MGSLKGWLGSAAMIAGIVGGGAAIAADFVVNDNGDGVDALVGDGVCEVTSGAGDCTLRAAIQESNDDPAFDAITFAGISEVALTTGLPKVMGRVLIDGSTGIAAAPRVILNGLTLHTCLEFESAVGADVPMPTGTTFQPQNSRIENLVVQSCDTWGLSLIGHGFFVRNNVIGLSADETQAAPNANEGILVSAASDQGAIPATFPNVTDLPPGSLTGIEAIAEFIVTQLPAELAPTAITGNVIAGNARNGIRLGSQWTTATIISGNKIGLASDGVTVFPNGTDGGIDANGIAITTPAYFNFIDNNVVAGQSGNINSNGIVVDSALGFPLPNVISNNYVGVTPADFTLDVGNSLSGIVVNGSLPLNGVNPLGVSTIVGPSNRIGFNKGNGGMGPNSQYGGIFLSGGGSGSQSVRVFSNEIGVVLQGDTAISVPNAGHGINAVGQNHAIGPGNIIGNNMGHGLAIRGNNSDFGMDVASNWIGKTPQGADIGNQGSGVFLASGGHALTNNTIAFNTLHGIQLNGANAWSDRIRENSIHDNGGLGIDLDNPAEGIDPADASGSVVDRSSSAKNYTNWQQNAPVLQSAAYDTPAGELTVAYTLASAPGGQYLVEFFLNDVEERGGKVFLGSQSIGTGAANGDGWGTVAGTFVVDAADDVQGKYVTATATDVANTDSPNPPGSAAAGPAFNTSEFSAPILVPAGSAAGTIEFVMAQFDAAEGDGTVTITAERTGGSDGIVTVDYAFAIGGSATADDDFDPPSGTLTWGNGDVANKTFDVGIVDDVFDEDAETVSLVLSNPTGGALLGATDAATLVIADNDDPNANGIKVFTGPTVPGTGMFIATLTGGGNPCGFDLAETAMLAAPPGADPVPPSLPSDMSEFVHGLFHATLTGCTVGASVSVALEFPLSPATTQLWRYGAVAGWSQIGSGPSSSTATLTIVDGGAGDDDGVADGQIVIRAVGPVRVLPPLQTVPAVIPATGSLALWTLALLVMGWGAYLMVTRARQ